jgi:hypothetical protein
MGVYIVKKKRKKQSNIKRMVDGSRLDRPLHVGEEDFG